MSKPPTIRRDIPCWCTWKFACLLNAPRWTSATCDFCVRAFYTLIEEPKEKELTAEEKERRKFCKKRVKPLRMRDVYGNIIMVTGVIIRNE